MARFFTIFLIVFLVGYWLLSFGSSVVNNFTYLLAQVTATITNVFDSDFISKPSSSLAHTLGLGISDGFFITVTETCSGLFVTVLLYAGILAYPLHWKWRLYGLIVGAVLIQIVNIIRLVSLVYIGHWYELSTFNFIHENVWPLLLQLWVLVIFLAWISYFSSHEPEDNVTS